jgi:hypothetical protein
MPRIAIGTPVEVDGLRGVVVGHRPQGMVDVQPEGEDFIIRKRESALRRLNPKRSKKAKKTVSRRSEVHRQHIEKTPKAGAQGSKKGKKGYQRKEKHKTRYNPEKGSPPLRVRREVEKMLHDPPSSWKALYKRAGLPARPSVEDFIDIVRSKTPSGRSAEAHYGREMGKGKHVPTRAVREAALLGLRLSYDNNYTSQSGVGLARAVQLVLDPSIDDLAKTRMRAYLTRHEKDKQGKNFGNLDRPSNGYMAWLNWGGDPAKEWLGMRDNPFFGFGRKRQPKPQVDPRDSFEDAIDLYAEYGRTADEVLVLACNQKGTGAAWYWLPGHQGLSVRAFERASARSIPKRYITTKDPTSTVISNLQEYRNPGRVTYIHVNAFTGEVTGPFKGSEVLPAAANPRSRKPDVIEKQDAQLVAVVQGIYESLMAKRLGVKSIYPPQGGERLDSMMIRMGTLSREEQREILSRAFAIATQQGQKHGYLRPKSQKPTAKGRRRAYKRQEDAAALEQNRQDYETTLALARKSASLRVVQKGRGSSKRFFVLPHVEGVNKRGYKTQRGAENAMERVLLRSNPSDSEMKTVKMPLMRTFHPAIRQQKKTLTTRPSNYQMRPGERRLWEPTGLGQKLVVTYLGGGTVADMLRLAGGWQAYTQGEQAFLDETGAIGTPSLPSGRAEPTKADLKWIKSIIPKYTKYHLFRIEHASSSRGETALSSPLGTLMG